MVTITCPWCDEGELLAMAELQEAEAAFTCADCGTSVAFVEEPSPTLDMAA